MPSENWNRLVKREFDNIPDTYLDWLLGQKWFVTKFKDLSVDVEKELAGRKRSYYHVPDKFDKILE
jgi:hypothetical protein